MTAAKHKKSEPTIVKKYANRRLYDTGRSSYVTLDDLCEMVKEGHDFIVQDAKTGEDLTRHILTQIIADQESRDGQNLLPTNFLRQLIGFYGDNIQSILPNYLEHTMENFAKNQEQLRSQLNKSLEGMFPVQAIDDISRQNMAFFENAMKAFMPFSQTETQSGPSNTNEQKIKDLKAQIDKMQKEIDRLSS